MRKPLSIFSVGAGPARSKLLNEILYCIIVINASLFGWRAFAPFTLTSRTYKAKADGLVVVTGNSK